MRIGETNDRAKKGSSDVVWSLKDINFEVQPGEVLGIIGRNGAGKSTLLKILSRVTAPTTGKVKVKGRIASLLEVGTGFHPELTGRENIYLNGAILGMRKREVDAKFDEIVDFSGVERYIDTPVKRYSSGMYVRLAFAVAAFLEPQILIVDEVLAVGDAEFQKKCLGRMKDVSEKEGRAVLFVSHNMLAIQSLCDRAILLGHGRVQATGNLDQIIDLYNSSVRGVPGDQLKYINARKGNGKLRFIKGSVSNAKNSLKPITSFSDVIVELKFQLLNNIEASHGRIDVGINNHRGHRIAWLSSDLVTSKIDFSNGIVRFKISQLPLVAGEYTCNVYAELNHELADWIVDVLPFRIGVVNHYNTGKTVPANQGDILLNYSFEN